VLLSMGRNANEVVGHVNLQILILIFAEVLGLYGLIVALILNTRSGETPAVSPTADPL
jgi:F0F1-type ATP synthase membrane subunit c/vacuolar-type H+-ATPase subunit K